jgi:hypothetical protein
MALTNRRDCEAVSLMEKSRKLSPAESENPGIPPGERNPFRQTFPLDLTPNPILISTYIYPEPV